MGGGEKKIIFVYDTGVWGKKYKPTGLVGL